MSGQVRTVCGDVQPAGAGSHQCARPPPVGLPVIGGPPLDDDNAALDQARLFAAAGGGALVQWTPPGMGRRAGSLPRIAERAGIHLIAATGLHQSRHYTRDGTLRWPATLATDELAALFVEELTQGMREDDGATPESGQIRAGVIKVAAGYHTLNEHQRQALTAAGAAHRITGAPICVHLELGTHGPQVLELLARVGAPPGCVVLGHLARNPDAQLHAELASTGAFLAYDGPLRHPRHRLAAR